MRVGVYSLRDGFRNFGDFIGPPIVSEFFSEPVIAADAGLVTRSPVLVAVGSILHLVQSGDGVWGAGTRFAGAKIEVSGVDYFAVRGPLTAKEIVANGGPKVTAFGDPGLLISSIPKYRELLQNHRLQGSDREKAPFLVIPHYSHAKHLPSRLRLAMKLQSASHSKIRSWLGLRMGVSKTEEGLTRWISPFQPLDLIVRHVLTSRMTISSSLHGLVTACSFGVPFRWWWPGFLSSHQADEGRFKYRDFLESLTSLDTANGNIDMASGSTVEECIRLGEQCVGVVPSLESLIRSIPDENLRMRYRNAMVS
ncbi:MAG: polysaccharide pyruvyl transferase family protein [Planctomycetota bacterium]